MKNWFFLHAQKLLSCPWDTKPTLSGTQAINKLLELKPRRKEGAKRHFKYQVKKKKRERHFKYQTEKYEISVYMSV